MPFTLHRNRMTHDLDLANLTGIEIGPLVNPIVTRDLSNVHYVDRASTEDLREWYSRDPAINVDDIMRIDYIWGEQSLAEATGGTEQFDYCVASHVIEHIPDLITWLGEISSILKVGGVACFAVPDKRYTFDYLRPLTTPADIIDNYLQKLRKPSFRHIFDHFSNFAELDIITAWSEGFNGEGLKPAKSPSHAYKACLDARDHDKYIDSHCSVFTEESFFDLLMSISEIGLLDFKIRNNFSVERNMFEFFVQLEKIDSSLSNSEKHNTYKDSYLKLTGAVLEIDFSCKNACMPKVYYDTGNGFNEADTKIASYAGSGKGETLKFKLPLVDNIKVRFDPAEFSDNFTVYRINYKTEDISLDAIKPLHGISKIVPSDRSISIKATRFTKDPAVLIEV